MSFSWRKCNGRHCDIFVTDMWRMCDGCVTDMWPTSHSCLILIWVYDNLGNVENFSSALGIQLSGYDSGFSQIAPRFESQVERICPLMLRHIFAVSSSKFLLRIESQISFPIVRLFFKHLFLWNHNKELCVWRRGSRVPRSRGLRCWGSGLRKYRNRYLLSLNERRMNL